MHELSIAQAVLEALNKALASHPLARVIAVHLRVGEFSGVDPDSLSFCFSALTRGTHLEDSRLAMEWVPLRHRCAPCGREFQVVDYDYACPLCGNTATERTSGQELDLVSLEIENAQPP